MQCAYQHTKQIALKSRLLWSHRSCWPFHIEGNVSYILLDTRFQWIILTDDVRAPPSNISSSEGKGNFRAVGMS